MAEIKVTKKEMSKILGNYKNNQSEGKMSDTKNKLTDLNDYLFEQLDRITNDDLKGEELTAEINRTKAVTDTAKAIIENSNLALNATKFLVDNGYSFKNNNALKLLGECEDD